MQIAPMPGREELRIQNLLSYNVLDSGTVKEFDELAALAAQVCDCQYAMITFIDREKLWIKGSKGLKLKAIPREISFCGHTILKDRILVVQDTKKDARFNNNPFVTSRH